MQLPVMDLSIRPVTLKPNEDIFRALKLFDETNAIIVVDEMDTMQRVKGIITTYDTTLFFRDISEGTILVEDIEVVQVALVHHYLQVLAVLL